MENEICSIRDLFKSLVQHAFDLLDKIPGTNRGPGGVICLYDRLITLKGNDRVIPINYL